MWTEHLNSAAIGKVLCAIAKVRTGFGKSDHPGSQGGLGKRGHGGTVNPLRNRKGGAGNPPPKHRRAPALSRPYRKGDSDSILASSLADGIARCRLKRRQRYWWAGLLSFEKPMDQDADSVTVGRKATRQPR